jgi:hypothetical protein
MGKDTDKVKITRLTDEQVAQQEVYRDKWIKIGLSTDPACRDKAEAAIKQMYTAASIPQPQKIVWCGSPLSQGLTRAIILDKRVRASVGDSVRDSVWASVWDSVWASVRASVRASVGASVRASVGDSVWASVRASVRASVWDSVRASVGDSGYGQHDASWLAFYEYFRQQCGLASQTERLTGLIEQSKHAGWYIPHQHICWVSERHHVLVRDERGRLHCENGPAVAYPDGWAIYAWHGVRVPESVILHRDKVTVKQIMAEQNTDEEVDFRKVTD